MSEDLDKKSIEKKSHGSHPAFIHKLDISAILVVMGVIVLFFMAIFTVMIAPMYIDKTWISPSSPYQVQMYEVEDPNIYISGSSPRGFGSALQHIHHLKHDFTLLSFKETENERIITSAQLDRYVTRYLEPTLKLTSRLLLLRSPQGDLKEKANQLAKSLQEDFKNSHPNWIEDQLALPRIEFLELYDPELYEVFSYNPSQGILQNWVDKDFTILDEHVKQPYHSDYGVIYVQNPVEYRVTPIKAYGTEFWQYDPDGASVKNLKELNSLGLNFRSRQELISLGEHIYAIEGCWYCHTDQTRTLVQDTVLNGSDSYPAPPSSANEYIYQKITFAGTRRIGPDISRVGIKRPSRDWHKGHFWSPKTASAGSIMPAFQHFFDDDPRGTGKGMGIPNYKFEAIYQYLMTKGTRITAPTQAWWLGKDPVKTLEIIEGRKVLQ
jgi:cytochrome c oxidase cbb3-type subunit II